MIHVLTQSQAPVPRSDRTLLEVALVSALAQTLRAEEVNLFKVQPAGTRLLLELIAHCGADGVTSTDTDFETPTVALQVESREETEACVSGEQAVAVQRQGDGAYVHCIPVAFDGKVAALVELVRETMLDPQQLEMADSLIGLYRNYLSLLEYSERDTLTGLLNRRTFDDQLAKILASLDRPLDPSALGTTERRETGTDAESHWLAVIDVDHFRRVNDKFGHLYGDEVLILLANLMRESFRHRDRLFRFGGEEFVIVLRPAKHDDVMSVLGRFRERVAAHAFPQVGQVTISIGFAAIGIGETVPEVLGNADEALHHAKSEGRNRVCSFEDLAARGLVRERRSRD